MDPQDGVILGDSPDAAVQDFIPQLSGIGEEKVVAVYNPLPSPFRVVFSRTKAYQPTPDANMQFAREKGLPLDKASPKAYVTQDVVLPAQALKNLPGDIAQIAVRKLTNTIIQTRNDDGSYSFDGRGGHKNMVSDPERRKQVEAEVIKGVYDATAFFNQEVKPITVQQATEQQIQAMNNPQEFSDVPGPSGFARPTEAALPGDSGEPDTAKRPTSFKAPTTAKAK